MVASKTPLIEARKLTKKYGDLAAVDGIDLSISAGEVFGLLGPNGAGKTTTILMLLGLTGPFTVQHQFPLMMRWCKIMGASQGPRRDLVETLDLVAKGKVKPMLETYPLDQINRAFERVETGKVRFRAVIQHAV